ASNGGDAGLVGRWHRCGVAALGRRGDLLVLVKRMSSVVWRGHRYRAPRWWGELHGQRRHGPVSGCAPGESVTSLAPGYQAGSFKVIWIMDCAPGRSSSRRLTRASMGLRIAAGSCASAVAAAACAVSTLKASDSLPVSVALPSNRRAYPASLNATARRCRRPSALP